MDMILFEVFLKSIDLIPQQQILQRHYCHCTIWSCGIKWIFFKYTSERNLSVCASGRGFTVHYGTRFIRSKDSVSELYTLTFFSHSALSIQTTSGSFCACRRRRQKKRANGSRSSAHGTTWERERSTARRNSEVCKCSWYQILSRIVQAKYEYYIQALSVNICVCAHVYTYKWNTTLTVSTWLMCVLQNNIRGLYMYLLLT